MSYDDWKAEVLKAQAEMTSTSDWVVTPWNDEAARELYDMGEEPESAAYVLTDQAADVGH